MPSSVILSKAPIKCLNIFKNHLLKSKVYTLSTTANLQHQAVNCLHPPKHDYLLSESTLVKCLPLVETCKPVFVTKQHLDTNGCLLYLKHKNYCASLPSQRAKLCSESEDTPKEAPKTGKPTSEQLIKVHTMLSNTLPHFFSRSFDYSPYHPDIIFVNNFRGTVSSGVNNYAKQLVFFKFFGHLCYAHIKLTLLHISKDEAHGTVKVHWQVATVAAFRPFLFFWKNLSSQKKYIEGISVYHVGDDGLIFKHIADKIIPQRDLVPPKTSGNIALKLAMIFGLVPGQDLALDFSLTTTAGVLVETIAKDLM